MTEHAVNHQSLLFKNESLHTHTRTHLDQQFYSCDPLEGKHKEGAKWKSLTNRVPLQFLHNPLEPGILIP